MPASALVATGNRDGAKQLRDELQTLAEASDVSGTCDAAVSNVLGHHDEALDLLELALERHDVRVAFLKIDACWNNLRATPRLAALVDRPGLSPGATCGILQAAAPSHGDSRTARPTHHQPGVAPRHGFTYNMRYNAMEPLMKLKVTTIGNSAGIILPRELLARLRLEKGDELFALETPDGIRLTTYDPTLAKQMEVAEEVMRKRRTLLHKLAQ